MLGQPMAMLIPQVVGFELTGKLREGATATDLVLTVTADAAQEGRGRQVRRVLRRRRARRCRSPTARRSRTWRRSTARRCGFFPVDEETLAYLRFTGRRTSTSSSSRLREGAGPLPRRRTPRAGVHRHARARSRHASSRARRARAPAGSRRAGRREGSVRAALPTLRPSAASDATAKVPRHDVARRDEVGVDARAAALRQASRSTPASRRTSSTTARS